VSGSGDGLTRPSYPGGSPGPSEPEAPVTGSPHPPTGGNAEVPAGAPAGGDDSGRRRRSIIRRIVAVAITGVAFYVVLPSLTRVLAAWPELSRLSPLWFIGVFVAEAASFACNFGLQRLVLRTKKWFAVVAAGLAGNAVTNVLPAGDAAGATVQFRMLATAGIESDDVAGGMTAASLLNLGGLLTLPVLTLPVVLGGAGVSAGLQHTALLGLVFFALYAVISIVVMSTDRPLALLGRAGQRLWNSLPGHLPKVSGLDRRLLSQRNDIRSTLGRSWRQAVLLSVGRLGFDFASLLAALRATGGRPRPSLVLLAYAAAAIVALVPLTPGGLGIVEASLAGLLVLAGVPAREAVVATLAYRLAQYWLPLLVGGISYLLFCRRYPSNDREEPNHRGRG
jgi:uncharacterized protein (TIRG00374 family)